MLPWIQNDELKLTYSTIETVPFEGNNRHFGVYHVSFANEGKKQITDVVCFIKIPPAKIEDWKVTVDPAMSKSESFDSLGYWLKIPELNPHDLVRVSLLATSTLSLPTHPEVSLRAKSITGIPAESKPTESLFFKDNSPFLMVMFILFASMFSILITRSKMSPIVNILSGGKQSGEQNEVLAYLAGVQGLTSEVDEYLRRTRHASYWAEADRLAALAIKENNPKYSEQILNLLSSLVNYADIATTSVGIIHYNIARLHVLLNKNDKAQSEIEMAKKLCPKVIDKRVQLDPLLNKLTLKSKGGST